MALKQFVESFMLGDVDQKRKYEYILNNYQVVRDEFTYSKIGEPLVTVWYVREMD